MSKGVLTGQVGDIPQQPDQEELHRQGVGALGFVIGNQLRELLLSAIDPPPWGLLLAYQKTYPGRQADTAKDARERLTDSGRGKRLGPGGEEAQHSGGDPDLVSARRKSSLEDWSRSVCPYAGRRVRGPRVAFVECFGVAPGASHR